MKRTLILVGILGAVALGLTSYLALAVDPPLTTSAAKPPATRIRIADTRATITYKLVDDNGVFARFTTINVDGNKIASDPNVSAQDKQKTADVFLRIAQYYGVAAP